MLCQASSALASDDQVYFCAHNSQACAGAVFPNLATLWLGNNHISGWESVDALLGLQALQELRLSGNPLVKGAERESRAEVKQRPQSCARHYISSMHI